jgi:hypothetical protein
LHREGASLIDFDGNKVPCIFLSPKIYDEIMNRIYGKKIIVDTLLNIFHDGYDVFVDIQLKFLNLEIIQNYVLYANDMLEFFEALANTGLIGLAPNSPSAASKSNIFMIQLPKKDPAENALRIIRSNVKK